MELKEFITNTLNQIAEGVANAKNTYKELGGSVNPREFKQIEGGIPYGKTIPINGHAQLLTKVHFEISITNDSSNENTSGIGVLFGAITVGGKYQEEEKHVSLNSISFDVPIKLP